MREAADDDDDDANAPAPAEELRKLDCLIDNARSRLITTGTRPIGLNFDSTM